MREMLIVILNEREGSAAVVRKSVRCHSESNYKKSSDTKQLFVGPFDLIFQSTGQSDLILQFS